MQVVSVRLILLHALAELLRLVMMIGLWNGMCVVLYIISSSSELFLGFSLVLRIYLGRYYGILHFCADKSQ